ncbi:hypothetical protein T4B_7587 [Trichinella pseudospiralis]|uniref:DUF5641 domain-containing protein n=1 Tax=Trichinella pseudospiralis TaxID=6337 RepID=A0A0V1HD09_TRIPS|nr:hypothetical protein T4B_7587 [Trichinella pseudospiralis]
MSAHHIVTHSLLVTYLIEYKALQKGCLPAFILSHLSNHMRTPERGPRNWQSRWRYRQKLIAKWWRRWRSEYVATLLPRRKWISSQEGPERNDLVLILEDNVPRARCPLRVVKELFPGSDGVIRAARLRTPNGEITMPVAKLVALEPARPSDGRPGLPPGGGLR